MEIKTRFKKARSSKESAEIFRSILNSECEVDKNKEHFWVMGLDNCNKIIYIELATLGIIDRSVVDPTVVYRFALIKGISRIIVCHNHPSGGLTPSDADIKITIALKKSGIILGIEFLDHIILGDNGHYSFAEQGCLSVHSSCSEVV